MSKIGRISISRLDIAVVLLLGLAGLGIWMVAERLIAMGMANWKPIEKQYQLSNDIPRLQSGLKKGQARLDKNQTKLVDQEIELESRKNALATLKKSYPQLPEAFNATEPADTLRSFADAFAARGTSQRRVVALERRLNELLAAHSARPAPSRVTPGQTTDVAQQAQSEMDKAERSSLQNKLVEERIAITELNISVESMRKGIPALHDVSDAADIPPEAVRSYVETQIAIRDAERQIAQLKDSAARDVEEIRQTSTALFEAERKSNSSLSFASALFRIIKSLLTLAAATIVTGLLLFSVFRLLRRNQNVATLNTRGVMWTVVALLAILFLYQAFKAASIALAGVAMLFMLCLLIAVGARRVRRARQAQSVPKTA